MNKPVTSNVDGRWQLVRAEFNGESAPDVVTGNTELILEVGNYEVRFGNEATDCGTFELGATGEWKTMVFHGIRGPNIGRTIPCIYQLSGNRLRICYGLDGILPGNFSVEYGQVRYLAQYKKQQGSIDNV